MLDGNVALLSCLRALHGAQSAVEKLEQQLKAPLDASALSSLQDARQAVDRFADSYGSRAGRETRHQLDALEAGLVQGLEAAWDEAVSVDVALLRVVVHDAASGGSADVHGAPVAQTLTLRRISAHPSATAPTSLASIAALLSQRSQLTLLLSALASKLTDLSAKLLVPSERWQIDDDGPTWSAEARGESSGVAALASLLRWLASRIGPLAQPLGSDLLPALQPHLLPALGALLPRELPNPLELPTEAADVARELHAALSLFLPTPTHYLKDDLQPLLLFAGSQGGEWTKSLCQHALDAARVLLLDTRGWTGEAAELSVADLIAPGALPPPPTEDGASGDEDSEASWDWNSGGAGEEAPSSQNITASSSSSGTTATSLAPGRRKGKATLGGVRVVRPSAQLGSGPLPDEEEDDAWGFDEDALDVPTDAVGQTAPRGDPESLSNAHAAPIEAPEDDAWFADEDVPSSQVVNTAQADAPRNTSFRAPILETELDEDVDEDAWGLSEAEKARRASLRGIPAGWVPPPEPQLDNMLEEDESAESSAIDPASAIDAPLVEEPSSSSASELPPRQAPSLDAAVSTISSADANISPGVGSSDVQHVPPCSRTDASANTLDAASNSQIALPLLGDDDDDLDDAWGLTEAEQVARAERRASGAFGGAFALTGLTPQTTQPQLSATPTAPDARSEALADGPLSQRADTSRSPAMADSSHSEALQEEQPSRATAPTVPDAAAFRTAIAPLEDASSAATPLSALDNDSAPAAATSAAASAAVTSAEAEPDAVPPRRLDEPHAESNQGLFDRSDESADEPQSLLASSRAGDVPPQHQQHFATSDQTKADVRDAGSTLPSEALPQTTQVSVQDLPEERDPWDLDDDEVAAVVPDAKMPIALGATVEDYRSDTRPDGDPGLDGQHRSARTEAETRAEAEAQHESAAKLPSTPTAAVREAAEIKVPRDDAETVNGRDEDAWGWNEEEAAGAASSSSPKLGAALNLRSPSSTARPATARTSSPRAADRGVAASPRLRQSALRTASAIKSAGASSPSSGSSSVSRSNSRRTVPPSSPRLRQESASDASVAMADKPATPAPLPVPKTAKCRISARASDLLALAERTLRSATALAEATAQMTDAQRSAWPDATALSAAVGDMFDLHCALMPTAYAAQLRSASLAAQFANDCAFIAQAMGRLQGLYDGSHLAGRQPALDLTPHAQKTAALGQMMFAAELDRQADLLDVALDEARRFEDVHEAERARSCEAAATRVLEDLRQLDATWQSILPEPARLGALGTLVEGVLGRVLREIEALEDISERESDILANVVKSFGPLEGLFVDAASGVSWRCDRGGGRSRADCAASRQQTAVALFVPSWFKCSYLSEILQGGLVDIDFLWSEAGALVDYRPEELSRLIRALFSDTPKRSKLLEKIALGHPQN